ncbi:hypothetical protein BSW62_20745 [Salmonella enterica subsp. enterica serovar Enteritidis]|nr:hypothetical protein [Salmonella enterica subsp. enterica serovar Enteritidis]
MGICPDTSPGTRGILFKISGTVAAENRVGQRARYTTGASMNCCFTVNWVVCGTKNIGEKF